MRDQGTAARIERALRAAPGVREARVSPLTGSVLVLFDPQLSRAIVDELLSRSAGAVLVESATATQQPSSPASKRARALAKTLLDRSVALEPKALRAQLEAVRVAGTEQLTKLLAALAADKAEVKRPTRANLVATQAPRTANLDSPAWHSQSVSEVCASVDVADEHGISTADAQRRLASDGPNALLPPPRRSEWAILAGQLTSMPVALLGVSAVLSIATGGIADAVAIVAVIGINAAIGYVTESGAERTIASLSHTKDALVVVRRDGATVQVPVEEVVRADLLVLHAGMFVAADARLVLSEDLSVDESTLTGESVPASKSAATLLESRVPLAERRSMVYRGTLVTGGSGLALVVATGARTELGHIQALAGSVVPNPTPMQQQLDQLGHQVVVGSVLACVATLGVGLLRGQAIVPMLRTAVSLAVAAVPEGLPTVAVTTLALGLSRMRAKRVIVRELAAVETLGAVQVVCVDKTGTLTVNRMTVTTAQAGQSRYAVRGGRLVDLERRQHEPNPDLAWLLRLGVLCSEVEINRERGVCSLKGSPTESALVQLALDAGVDAIAERAAYPVLNVRARSEKRSYMTTQHQTPTAKLWAVKGRPSEVLALCDTRLQGGVPCPLSDEDRVAIETDNERMAGAALRVLGLAFSEAEALDEHEPKLVWVGLVGMQDPPRDGVAEVIARFRGAGVRTVMITGDQSATAQAIGKQISLSQNGHLEIVDSTRLDQMDPEVLAAIAQRADVFARVSPAHKLQIVQALQRAGLVVAMTGDGVNDSPALRAADIGIAMGGSGTNVARSVADVVLEDDELRTLIDAIEQGRTIYDDIRKAVHFILSTNIGEVLYTFTCVAAGLGEVLTPMQLLWINLLTDVFPELALAAQPPESDVLARPPRDPKRPMFTKQDLWRIGSEGTVITAGALAAYLWARSQHGPGAYAGTVGFTALTLAQLLHAWSTRSETHTIFDREHLAHNRWLLPAVGGMMALQVAANVVPGLRTLLGTVPIGPRDWAVACGAAVTPFLINELVKYTTRPSLPNGPNHAPTGAALPLLLPAPAE